MSDSQMDTTLVDHEKECTLLVMTTSEQEISKDEALTVEEKTDGEPQDVKQAENIVPANPDKRKAENSMESPTPKMAKSKPGKGVCLYVGHLNNSKTLDEIKDALMSFFTSHNVLAQDIELHPNRKFGFVHFVSEGDLKKALDLNKSKVLNKPVRLAMPTKDLDSQVFTRGKKKAASAATTIRNTTRSLFVNNLPYKIRENVLKRVFPKAVSVCIPQSEGKARGFAFVEFRSVSDAQAAMKTSQDTVVAKRKIRLQLCQTKSGMDAKNAASSKSLMITGLSEETSEETLQNAFEGALSARLVRDRDTGVLMGFGFVDFDNNEDCKATKEAMEDCEIDGKKIRIDYAKAQKVGRRGNGN